MQQSSFDTRFSVLCLPENPRLFMLNMQVFRVQAYRALPVDDDTGEPEAMVWCAVYQHPVVKKR
ncbi:MAG: hypothetical protein ACNA71_05420 [Kiritimatiellia bacterium]